MNDNGVEAPSMWPGRVQLLQMGNYLKVLMTALRDEKTPPQEFRQTVDRVGALLVAAGRYLSHPKVGVLFGD